MKIRFIGDTHIGKRPSHSTRASAQRHKGKVDEAIRLACDTDADLIIQLGDVFDSYQVSNNDMVRALSLYTRCDILVRGNHDFSHNSFNVSALEDLGKLGTGSVISSSAMVYNYGKEQPVHIHVVPYMPTQEEFIRNLAQLEPIKGGVNILCLHTNMYAEGFKTSEVENNLTPEHAEALSQAFDLVVSGHEHNGCQKSGVYMVGCLFPMSFGDMSDKHVLDYDTEAKGVTQVTAWGMEGHYTRLDSDEFLSVPVNHTYDFIEVYGSVPSTSILRLVKHMNMLMAESSVSSIKNSVKVIRAEVDPLDKQTVTDWQTYVKDNLTIQQFELFQEMMK